MCATNSATNTPLRAAVQFADGRFPVEPKEVAERADQRPTLRRNLYELVRGHEKVNEFLASHSLYFDQKKDIYLFSTADERELADIVAGSIKQLDPQRAGSCSSFQLSSVIYRNVQPRSPENRSSSQYTNVCHRDIDETAVKNFFDHERLQYFYNGTEILPNHVYHSNCLDAAWIPFQPVGCFPIGLIDPESVSTEHVTGFMGLDQDRTGLRFHQDHEWLWAKDMQPGDMWLWASDRVFHAAFPLLEDEGPRISADFRIYFGDCYC